MTRLFLTAALAATCLAMPALAEGIEVHDAYAIAARPDAPSGAAFMVIHNHGGADDRLIGARAPVAERVELHTHIMDGDGVARMVEVEEGWALPTDGEIVLERGGNHVMFIGITDSFEDGDIIPLTLIFETAGEITVDVPVDLERLGGGAMGHGAGQDGGHGDGHGAHGGHGG